MLQFWKQLHIKRRWQILSACAIGILIIAYQSNLKITFSVYSQYQKLSRTNDSLISEIKAQEQSISKRQTTEPGNNTDISERISILSENNQVDIVDMAQYANSNQDNYTIKTNKLTISGNYSNTLKFIYQLENNNYHGVHSLNCELSKDKLSGEYKLLTTLLIKTIIYEK